MFNVLEIDCELFALRESAPHLGAEDNDVRAAMSGGFSAARRGQPHRRAPKTKILSSDTLFRCM